MFKLLQRVFGIVAVLTLSACFASANTTSGATTSVVPGRGISASGVASNVCSGAMWNCVNDPIGYNDQNSTYVYTTGSSGEHVLGFSGSISNITSVSMHVVAASNGGSGTLAMSFYNNGQLAGQGGTKTINSGSGYTELVSGIFYTSVSNLSNLTMKVSLTGRVKYTAIWLDLTYGPAGTTYANLENYLVATGGAPSDYDWDKYQTGNIWIGGSCTSAECAGGAQAGSVTLTRSATSPSRNGDTSATKVVASAPQGSGTSSALEWVKMNGSEITIPYLTPNQTSVTGDWWIYVSNASSNNPRTLEFDLFWGNGTNTAMWGTHCEFGDAANPEVWKLDAQDAAYTGIEWQPAVDAQTGLAIPCNLAPSQWHHIRWQVHQDPNVGKIYYDYLTIDDATHILTGASKTRSYKDPTRTQFDTLGIQVQQDMNVSSSSPVSVTEYVDSMSLTYW